jgi:Na+:H+ antiporter, NhaA family
MKLTTLFNEFFHSEKSGGIVLIVCTAASLVASNSAFHDTYQQLWDVEAGNHTIAHWINDGLMTIFFLLIGLELEREIYVGELSNFRNALLPVFAAVGGMIFPALIHLMFSAGTPFQSGAGIPMATDIVFAIGVLSLLGSRVPAALKVFLTALAVIDDLGAIIVIAVFYTGTISWLNFFISVSVFGVLLVLNRLKIHNLIPYLAGGLVMWYFMSKSGVHATITGVLLAFAVPFGNGSPTSPSYILQRALHVPVAFVIVPLFALANTAVTLGPDWHYTLLTTGSLAIIAGLAIGKPVGISLLSFIAVRMKVSSLPDNLSYGKIIGAAFLGGIGFTMSIFITLLAFSSESYINSSKIAVIAGSLVSGIIGYVILKTVLSRKNSQSEE